MPPPGSGGGVVVPASTAVAPELLLLDPVVPAPLELDPVGRAPELDEPPELLLELDPEPAPELPGPAPLELLELELLGPPAPPLELELLEPVPLTPDELPLLEAAPVDDPELLLAVPTETGALASGAEPPPASTAVVPVFVGGSKPLGSVDAVSAAHAARNATDRATPVRTDVFFMTKASFERLALLTRKALLPQYRERPPIRHRSAPRGPMRVECFLAVDFPDRRRARRSRSPPLIARSSRVRVGLRGSSRAAGSWPGGGGESAHILGIDPYARIVKSLFVISKYDPQACRAPAQAKPCDVAGGGHTGAGVGRAGHGARSRIA